MGSFARSKNLVTRISISVLLFCSTLNAQQAGTTAPAAPGATPSSSAAPATQDPGAKGPAGDDKAVNDVKAAAAQVKAIKEALKEDDPDWALVLGIGSLVKGRETDYQNESNVIRASNLGRATPQL